MCGISGVYHFKNSQTTSEGIVTKMRDTLTHRGPDGAGVFISKDQKIGLGHRRLAIIDLSPLGSQPMTSKSQTSNLKSQKKSAWITYNGEVYNFLELRKELEKMGYQFKSKTDTEVILNSYLEWGVNCVKRFNGMFAFVIWDEDKKTLFAARDHVGIKPFYYAIQNGTFYFGSEIKAILAHENFHKELNEQGVSHYLTFATSPEPTTLFNDVHKLPAGCFLTLNDSKEVKIENYWNPVSPENHDIPENEYIEKVRELLKSSIRSQMVSDVPFGCFLSGGIDSSTNATLMSQVLGHPVKTFSVGAKGYEKYNEFRYSRIIANKLGIEPHEIFIDESNLLEFLPKFGWFADDPNGDQVCVPLYWLSKLTRDSGVKMVQIGEGSDELFYGYETYLKAFRLYKNIWRTLEKLPRLEKRFIFSAGNLLLRGPRFDFYKGYVWRLAKNQNPYWGNAVAFSDYQKNKLLSESFKNSVDWSGYPIIQKYYETMRGIEPNAGFLRKLLFLELKHRLPELLLARADKMTMAHSIEGRVPFLDKRLVELAFQIPALMKIKGGEAKYILKKAVEGIIPNEIIYRKKQGFAAPMREWFLKKSPASEKLLSIIRNSKIHRRNVFNKNYIEYTIKAHQSGNVDHNFRLWNLVTLSLWYDEWFK